MANVKSEYNNLESQKGDGDSKNEFSGNQQFHYVKNNNNSKNLQTHNNLEALASRRIKFFVSFAIIILLIFCLSAFFMLKTLITDDNYIEHWTELSNDTKHNNNLSNNENRLPFQEQKTAKEETTYHEEKDGSPKSRIKRIKRNTDEGRIERCKRNKKICEELFAQIQNDPTGIDTIDGQMLKVLNPLTEPERQIVIENFKNCLDCRSIAGGDLTSPDDETGDWLRHSNRDTYGFEPTSMDVTKINSYYENGQSFQPNGFPMGTGSQQSQVPFSPFGSPVLVCFNDKGAITELNAVNGVTSEQSFIIQNLMNQPSVQQELKIEKVGPTGPGSSFFTNTNNVRPINAPQGPIYCTYVPSTKYQSTLSIRDTNEKKETPKDSKTIIPRQTRYPFVSYDSAIQPISTTGLRSDSRNKGYGTSQVAPNVVCREGELLCKDKTSCVAEYYWCDGTVHCKDASDETDCTCKERLDPTRICDGVFDCLYGDDEAGCFICSQDMFSCGDTLNTNIKQSCFSREQRCDGVPNCVNGRDEKDCSILTPSPSGNKDMFISGHTTGYLHRNVRGVWYPVCYGTKLWVKEACDSEIDFETSEVPKFQEVSVRVPRYGPLVVPSSTGSPQFVLNCNEGVHVKCPEIPCGLASRNGQGRSSRKTKRSSSISSRQIWGYEYDQDAPIVGIVGGQRSLPKSWPFLVALYKNGAFTCGGAIVTEEWILTAAHCTKLFPFNYYEIKAGATQQNAFSPSVQVRKVIRIVDHPHFNIPTLVNDISLLKLDEPLYYNRWIRPVCVPQPSIQFPPPYSMCTVVGWGSSREGGPAHNSMQEVDVPISPVCKYKNINNDNIVCAGYKAGGKDACQGDSGGPLLCRQGTQWFSAGVVSYGEGCARPNEEGVYTRVSKYTPWMISVILKHASTGKDKPLLQCNGFQCQSGTRQCIATYKQCNRKVNCLNAEDEVNCSNQNIFREAADPYLANESQNHVWKQPFNFERGQQTQSESPLKISLFENNPSESPVQNFRLGDPNWKPNVGQDTQSERPEGSGYGNPPNFFNSPQKFGFGNNLETQSDKPPSFGYENIQQTGNVPQNSGYGNNQPIHSVNFNQNYGNFQPLTENPQTIFESGNAQNSNNYGEIQNNNIDDMLPSGYQNPPQLNPGYQNSPQLNPGYQNPPQPNLGYQNPPQSHPGYQNPLQQNPGYQNTPQPNPGYQNPPQSNSGYLPPINFGHQNFPQTNSVYENLPQAKFRYQNMPQSIVNPQSFRSGNEPQMNSGSGNEGQHPLVNPEQIVGYAYTFPPPVDNPDSNLGIGDIQLPAWNDTDNFPGTFETQTQPNDNEDEKLQYVLPTNRFTCKTLLQIVPADKRCNGHFDCEDGTDEEDCSCREVLQRDNPKALCDGHIDCYDGTDEEDCVSCNSDEYHCRRSGSCIPMNKRCDKVPDCTLNEDELNCFSLSNGEYVNMDTDDRPHLNSEGVITMFQNGAWAPFCYKSQAPNFIDNYFHLGSRFCQYLGFRYLEAAREVPVKLGKFPERKNVIDYEYPPAYKFPNKNDNQVCQGLYIRCKPSLSNPVNAYLSLNRFSKDYSYQWPWMGAIFKDGNYHCPTILLKDDWLLTSSECSQNLDLANNYTVGVFGLPSYKPAIYRPHQQIMEIDEIKGVKNSDASLFHLKRPLNRTRYVQPIFHDKRIFLPTETDICLAAGVDKHFVAKTIFVKPVLECDKCRRCFIESQPTYCNNNTESRDWSGTVSCLGPDGWYPAAVFEKMDSICSFHKSETLDGIDYMYGHISDAMSNSSAAAVGPECDGKRCLLGKCVPWSKICDGIDDCPDKADEHPDLCDEAKKRCIDSPEGCKCNVTEIRCGNGKCVPKASFCDGNNDCGDGTDEPYRCTCASYLGLTASHRLCDNKRDCYDKSDEDPDVCSCKDASFFCKSRGSGNDLCISSDMVCDGDKDCPNGEDEDQCIDIHSVLRSQEDRGEVIKQSFGVWHSFCLEKPVTSDLEAAKLCQSLGFKSGILADELRVSFMKPVTVATDDFYMVRLNNVTVLSLRQDRPLVTLVEAKGPCYRLSIQCA